MGQRLTALVLFVSATALPAWADDQDWSPVQTLAMEYFENRTNASVDEFLTRSRPEPLGRADCDAVIASLPKEGEIQPTPGEVAKIHAALPVLQYHYRQSVVTFKVIELNHAFLGLHARSVLLVSRIALWRLDTDEFVALVAHEIAHDYMWDEYRQAMDRKDKKKMQELELRCDAIAVLTLRRVGLDPERLVSAVQKLTWLNQLREAVDSSASYVPLKERIKFIRTMAGLQWE